MTLSSGNVAGCAALDRAVEHLPVGGPARVVHLDLVVRRSGAPCRCPCVSTFEARPLGGLLGVGGRRRHVGGRGGRGGRWRRRQRLDRAGRNRRAHEGAGHGEDERDRPTESLHSSRIPRPATMANEDGKCSPEVAIDERGDAPGELLGHVVGATGNDFQGGAGDLSAQNIRRQPRGARGSASPMSTRVGARRAGRRAPRSLQSSTNQRGMSGCCPTQSWFATRRRRGGARRCPPVGRHQDQSTDPGGMVQRQTKRQGPAHRMGHRDRTMRAAASGACRADRRRCGRWDRAAFLRIRDTRRAVAHFEAAGARTLGARTTPETAGAWKVDHGGRVEVGGGASGRAGRGCMADNIDAEASQPANATSATTTEARTTSPTTAPTASRPESRSEVAHAVIKYQQAACRRMCGESGRDRCGPSRRERDSPVTFAVRGSPRQGIHR